MAAPIAAKTQMTAQQQTAYARDLIWRKAKPIFQMATKKNFSGTVTAGANTMSVNPLQIGFLRRFVVEVTGTITNTGTTTALTLTPNGADNLLTNVTFNDFTGNPRHNCSARALSFVEAFKYRRIPGAATTTDSVSGFGSNIASNVAPGTIAASGTTTAVITRIFSIPIMQDTGKNMTGGLWLGVNNQSTLLNLTINSAAVIASGDPTTAIYTGNSGTLSNVTVTVYQDYWNNVPTDKNGNPILPVNDIQTAYMITETNSGMTFATNQASSWNFPTFSKILGTYLTYDNNGTLNPGTDLSTIALVVSNYAIIKQFDPNTLDRMTRDLCGASFPKGSYGLSSRDHPLDVSQYPSLQLQVTPSLVNSGATMLITTELLRPVQYMAAAAGVGGA